MPYIQLCTNTLEETYASLIVPLDDTVAEIRKRLDALSVLTEYMEKYDETHMQDLLTGEEAVTSLTFIMLSAGTIALFISILTGLSLLCVGTGHYAWRKGIHVGWTVLSLSLCLLLVCAGVLLPGSVFLGEACPIVKGMLDRDQVGVLVVGLRQGGAAGEALQSCFQSNFTFDTYISATDVLAFLPAWDADYERIAGYKYHGSSFQFYTLSLLKEETSTLQTTTFLSSQDQRQSWQSQTDIPYFLSLNTSSKASQSDLHTGFYLNDYTDYASGTAQFSQCKRIITNDYWTYEAGSCPAEYTYLPKLLLILSSTAQPNCYALSDNFTQTDLNSRYINLGMYTGCSNVGGKTYTSAVMDYWTAANQSYTLELSFRGVIRQLRLEEAELEQEIRSKLLKIGVYSSALLAVHPSIDSLVSLNPALASNLLCPSLQNLTNNLYRALCGELLPNTLMLALASGGLAVVLMAASVAAMMGHMWFRTDLEMDKESVMRQVGRGAPAEVQKETEAKGESLFEAASERTILESEASIRLPAVKPGLAVFQVTKPPKKPKFTSPI